MLKSRPEILITITYILLGFLWILYSDKLLLMIASDMKTLSLLQTYKGWFYILLTGFLLYIWIKKELKKRNIINQQLNEAQLKAEESENFKSRIITNLSHEIRTPMNAILGFSELLRNARFTPGKQREFINIVEDKSKSFLQTIDDIIDIAQIESNQLKTVSQPIKIDVLLEEILLHYNENKTLNTKSIVLTISNYIEKGDEVLYTDKGRLYKVFIKLIDNAIKFSNNGKVEFGCKEIHDNYVCFYVKDSGLGISKENQAKIFGNFEQVGNSLDGEFSGIGLGLSIAKRFVELLGGNLTVNSDLGKGAVFYFNIPKKQNIDPVKITKNKKTGIKPNSE